MGTILSIFLGIGYVLPTREEFLAHDYTSEHIISTIGITTLFFMWCMYRLKLFSDTPDTQRDPGKVIYWIIVFMIIRYMVPTEIGILFTLVIITFVMLLFMAFQVFVMLLFINYFYFLIKNELDLMGGLTMLFNGCVLVLFGIADFILWEILSNKYYN